LASAINEADPVKRCGRNGAEVEKQFLKGVIAADPNAEDSIIRSGKIKAQWRIYFHQHCRSIQLAMIQP
jgi:hypothetical protein